VPAGISLASGCISGFLTATVTFPLDVVRRRMQVRASATQLHLQCKVALPSMTWASLKSFVGSFWRVKQ
jgi:hypothetical protein